MSIEVMWDTDEELAVRHVIEGRWTWDEMRAAVAEADGLLDSSERGVVHIIMDGRNSEAMPKGAIFAIPKVYKNEHPKTGMVIIVGHKTSLARAVTSRMLGMLRKIGLFPRSIEYAETLEEARELVERYTEKAQE